VSALATPPVGLAIDCRSLEPGVLSIHANGELDLSTLPKLEPLLAAIPPRARAALDLSALEFLDLAGARLLLSAKRRLGERLQIARPGYQPLRLLRAIGLEASLELEPSLLPLDAKAFSWLDSRRDGSRPSEAELR